MFEAFIIFLILLTIICIMSVGLFFGKKPNQKKKILKEQRFAVVISLQKILDKKIDEIEIAAEEE